MSTTRRPEPSSPNELQFVETLQAKCAILQKALSHLAVVQSEVIEKFIISILAGAHTLLSGQLGVGEEQLLTAISGYLGLSFRRLRMTGELAPWEIGGERFQYEDKGKLPKAGQCGVGPVL
jgi:MoxR-like ATPase